MIIWEDGLRQYQKNLLKTLKRRFPEHLAAADLTMLLL
jgi:hypothetical protein